MKILVVSDSHGSLKEIDAAVSAESPDMLLHLGDYAADFNRLANSYRHLQLKNVSGNCDRSFITDTKRIFNVGEKRIFMTHGHLYRVKQGLEALYFAALEANADIVLFGHTHTPFLYRRDGVLFINPGSSADGCYAVLTVNENSADAQLMHLRCQ